MTSSQPSTSNPGQQSAWQRFRARLPTCSPGKLCTCTRPASSSVSDPDKAPRPKPWEKFKFSSRRTDSSSEGNSEQKTSLLKSTMTRTRDDLRHLRFWRAVFSEFLGTMLYVIVGCGAWTETTGVPQMSLSIRVALAFGLIYAVIIYCVRNVTDAHLNPSITLAMLVTRRMCFLRAILYIIAQFLGAILGAALLYGLTAREYLAQLGCTVPGEKVSDAQGFGIELFSTFILVFVVFAAYEKSKREEAITAPFIIGIALAAVSMFAIPYTGGSLNTARSFGPAVIKNVWSHHWIYWFGPLLGGILGGACYEIVYSTKATLNRMRACMLVFHRGPSDPVDIEGDAEMGVNEAPEAESDMALHTTKLGEECQDEETCLGDEIKLDDDEDDLKK